MQIVLDAHACVEYVCKYSSKPEKRSEQLGAAFDAVMHKFAHLGDEDDASPALRSLVMRTVALRDVSSQEVAHILMGLPLTDFDLYNFTLISDPVAHTFTVDELGIDVEVAPGESNESMTFNFDKSGTFKVRCRIHESQGMVGTIHVAF